MANKYYAVRNGHHVGVFETWDECSKNVTGYKGAEFKSFKTYEEAEAYLNGNNEAVSNEVALPDVYAFIDGSYNAEEKLCGYGGFLSVRGQSRRFHGASNNENVIPFRNIAGEVLGSIEVIKLALNLKLSEITIYYDYKGIEEWALGRWKRNNELTEDYHNYYDSIKNKIKINFKKVDAHTGIEGNEIADALAKKAVGNPLTAKQQRLLESLSFDSKA